MCAPPSSKRMDAFYLCPAFKSVSAIDRFSEAMNIPLSLLLTDDVIPSSRILSNLKMDATRSSQM